MELAGSVWTLVSFETETGVIPIVSEAPATLTFATEGEQTSKIHGNGGCNRYFASYTLTDDQLHVSQIGSTRMMCSPAQMAQENRFFQALSAAERYERNNNELLIIYTGGTLRFTPAVSHTEEA